MRLNFCSSAYPMLTLLPPLNTVVKGENASSHHGNLSRNVSCEEVGKLVDNDRRVQRFYEAYVDILQRSEFILEEEEVKDSQSQCKLCQEAYKDWLCSSTYFEYHD